MQYPEKGRMLANYQGFSLFFFLFDNKQAKTAAVSGPDLLGLLPAFY